MHHATFSIEVILYLIPFCLGRDCLKALWGLEIEGEGLMWWGSPSVGDGTHTVFLLPIDPPKLSFQKVSSKTSRLPDNDGHSGCGTAPHQLRACT